MNPKPLVVVLLLLGLLTIGWLGWRSFAGSDDPELQATHKGDGNTATEAQDLQKAKVDGAAVAGTGVSPAAERTEAPRTADGGNGRLVTIRGRLVDAAGAPCSDAKLRYRTRTSTPEMEFLPLREDASDAQDLGVGRDGAFSFAIAQDRSARLELVDAERLFEHEPQWLRGAEGDRDLGNLVVLTGAGIAGVVQDATGRGVADVKVAANLGDIGLGFGFGGSAATTDAEGRFRIGKLRGGEYSLRTASAKFLPTSTKVAVEKGQQIADVVLTVAMGNAIAGQVVDDLGRPVAGIKVGAKRNEARPGIEVERFSNDEATATDAGGYFTLTGIDGDAASVRARGKGYATAIAANVPVGSSDLVLRLDRMSAIEGVLVAADGRPIAGSKVRANAQPRGLGFGHGIESLTGDRAGTAVTAADGAFHIDDVAPGSVDLEASGDAHRPVRSKGIVVPAAQVVKGIRLVAERGASVQVAVFDVDDKPLRNAKVEVAYPGTHQPQGGVGGFVTRSRRVEAEGNDVRVLGDDEALASGTTDAEGKVLLAGLPAERLEVRASHPDFAAAKPQTFGLLANTTIDVELRMRPPAHIEAHVVDSAGKSLPGARVRLSGPLGLPEAADIEERSDENGIARFGPVLAGEYGVSLLRGQAVTRVGGMRMVLGGSGGDQIGGSERQCRVRAGETTQVEVRMPLLTRVFGTVTGVDGPVAECVVELNQGDAAGMSLPGMSSGGRSATTNAQGEFEIADVEPGDYTIEYGRGSQLVKARSSCSVAKELPELRQDLVLRLGKVRVQAVEADGGAPIAGVEVEIARQGAAGVGGAGEHREVRMAMVTIASSGDGPAGEGEDTTMMTIGTQRAKTGADGFAEILDVPVGTYEVRLTHKKHAPATRRDAVVAELQTTEVGRVEMTQAGRITGTIVGADGKAPQIALVSYHRVGETDEESLPAMDGSFRIDSLVAGRYALRARQMGAPGAPGASGEEVEVDVKGGESVTTQLKLPVR